MKKEVKTGILVAVFLGAVIGGTALFLHTGIFGPSYPIDSIVNTTLERTVIPVPVPLSSPALLPQQVANYSEHGCGAWRFGKGVPYVKRLDLIPDSYAAAPVTKTVRLLNFFAMTDIHITDKESPAQAVYYGYKWGMISGYSPAMLYTTQFLDAAVQTANALHKKSHSILVYSWAMISTAASTTNSDGISMCLTARR